MKKFNAVEQAIFAVIMDDCTGIKDINEMFYIFDKKVIAKAICHLVNSQLVIANLPRHTLMIAPVINAVFSKCEKSEFELKTTSAIVKAFSNNAGIISFNAREENNALTNYLFDILFSEIDLSYYANYITFALHDIKGYSDEQ